MSGVMAYRDVGMLVCRAIHLCHDDRVYTLEALAQLLVRRCQLLAMSAPWRVHLQDTTLDQLKFHLLLE